MRRVRFSVAVSLDGYIAGPNGESDWIVMDPDMDFRARSWVHSTPSSWAGKPTRQRGTMVEAGCQACRPTSSRARSVRQIARA